MAKPLDQFGGWLKFYYITKWLAAILGFLAIVVFALAIIVSEALPEMAYQFLYLLDGVALTVTSILVIRILRVKEQTVPKKVIRLILVYAVITVVLTVIQMYMVNEFAMKDIVVANELKELGRGMIKTLIWTAFWANYFKKSKRVISYYGLLSSSHS